MEENKRGLLNFLKAEITRGYALDIEEERFQTRRDAVYMFMAVPREMERLMGYGFFQCLDAFLFLFTYLPLRVAHTLVSAAIFFTTRLGFPGLKPAERCDILKLSILLLTIYLFSWMDTSVLYHVIKSQSVIKLYIFFNMLEVGDRLFASFVQDTIDSLFLTATEEGKGKSKMGVTAHFCLVLFAVFGHALVILLQGTTLSVAINASNRALMTVIMSNNFVELKGAVFKKFDKINLFQVSCSDVRERFHLCVLLLVVCLQTMREYSWEESRFWVLLPDCLLVLLSEVGVDWVKHCFITRFNEIPAEVYREYTLSMAYDLAQTKQRRAFSDHSDMVGRRLGFVPLPLAVVLARVLRPCFGVNLATFILTALGFVALASFRTLNSILLLGKACDLIEQHTPTPHVNPTPPASPSPPAHKLRSQSASHSPRHSVSSQSELDHADAYSALGYAPLLPANSLVSILSAHFNEEMIKNEGGVKREVSARKHSLGSMIRDSETLLSEQGMKDQSEEPIQDAGLSNPHNEEIGGNLGEGGNLESEPLNVGVESDAVMKARVQMSALSLEAPGMKKKLSTWLKDLSN